MNLLQNSVQAIEGKGAIRVTTTLEKTNVCVEVADNGRGISAEHLERVFEPGYTTKPRGVGTGLGLAIVYSTVQDHGGAVHVESEAGSGTTVRVTLPVGGAG